MFAVPGWKLDLVEVKRQEEPAGGSDKKRKRKQSKDTAETKVEQVETHVGKKQKVDRGTEHVAGSGNFGPAVAAADSAATITPPGKDAKPNKKQQKKERQKQKQLQTPGDSSEVQNADERDIQPKPTKKAKKEIAPELSPAPPPATSRLTPLQSAMRQKLISARFRHLNEALYTAPSKDSRLLFDSNPGFFEEYHSGFRQQVSNWPENPVDTFVRDLFQRGKLRNLSQKKQFNKGKPEEPPTEQLAPLPRNQGTCKVADLGCGDAALAQKVHKDGGKLSIQVLSYDLAAPNKLITKADIANLPLQEGSINIAIFCLALMGTNWIDFIEEAYRVLHWKGELWVAEIKSRFGKVGRGRVEHSVGFRQKKRSPTKADNQKQKAIEDDENRKRLAEEVDEAPTAEGTDVGAFVEVLRRRGFALQDKQAVDLSNKMFVKMRFTKSLPAVTGKNVKEGQMKEGVKRGKVFIEKDEDEVNEKAVLKPCLYKVR